MTEQFSNVLMLCNILKDHIGQIFLLLWLVALPIYLVVVPGCNDGDSINYPR